MTPTFKVVGLGLDLCETARIAGVLARQGERFARRVLGDAELALFQERRARSEARAVAFLATRFAAKEAFSKALGTGMCLPMAWRACEVLPDAAGKPTVHCHGALAGWMAERRWSALVSVTDERGMVAATVLVQEEAAHA
jgi:holo-[acyl-carrier protein] synthase